MKTALFADNQRVAIDYWQRDMKCTGIYKKLLLIDLALGGYYALYMSVEISSEIDKLHFPEIQITHCSNVSKFN